MSDWNLCCLPEGSDCPGAMVLVAFTRSNDGDVVISWRKFVKLKRLSVACNFSWGSLHECIGIVPAFINLSFEGLRPAAIVLTNISVCVWPKYIAVLVALNHYVLINWVIENNPFES